MTLNQSNSLKNKGIVITRPIKQAQAFARNIKKVGGCPLIFPLIEITPLNDDQTIAKLNTLDDYDLVIFISVNAVEQCIHLVGTDVLKTKILVSTGKKTAKLLTSHALTVTHCPQKYFNSEALLEIESFTEQAKNKNIAIIRGSSGRDYLKNNLINLGASVDYIDVYKRHCPQQSLNKLKNLWQQGKLNTVILTSASSTASFFSLAKKTTEEKKWMNEINILIGSSRMQHEIPSWFNGNMLIAEDPSDETLLNKLMVDLN